MKINLTVGISSTLASNLSSTYKQSESEALRIVTLTICLVVITLGVIGNSLVVVIFLLKWSKLKSFEIFMISLGIADWLNAVVAPSQSVLELVSFNFYHIGNNGCKAISFISITSMTVTPLTLLTVSIDRFIVVKWPMHRRRYQDRTLLLIIVFTWLSASALGSAYLIEGNICLQPSNIIIRSNTHNSVFECYICMARNHYTIFVLAVFSIQTGVPIIVMTLLYTLIVFELRKNAKCGLFKSRISLKLHLMKNRKATKLVVTVVVVFSFCFLPINLFYLWYLFNRYVSTQKIKIAYDILTMLQMCNSIANPIIYSKLHTTFQQYIVRIFFPCRYRNLKKPQLKNRKNGVQRILTELRDS